MLFPTGFLSKKTFAGSPFDIIEGDRNAFTKGLVKVRQQPNSGFVAMEGDGIGIAILNEGLYEYEHLEKNGTLALTLLRGNGFISNNQSAMSMEETWLVPENQCPGKATFKIAIYPFTGNIQEAPAPK